MADKQDYKKPKTYSAEQLLRMILHRVGAALGTPYITASETAYEVDSHGFEASEDSTITSVITQDANGDDVDMIDFLDLTDNQTLVVKAHQLVTWGFVATKVTLATGSGLLIRADQLTIPLAPEE